jgi:hypothetical protein
VAFVTGNNPRATVRLGKLKNPVTSFENNYMDLSVQDIYINFISYDLQDSESLNLTSS